MIVYLDSSALLKRVIAEAESSAVVAVLGQHAAADDLLCSSALTWIEVARALRRAEVDRPDDRAADALAGVDRISLGERVMATARSIGPSTLRSLDALHLAAAVEIRASRIVTYDERLAAAARGAGIEPLAPST